MSILVIGLIVFFAIHLLPTRTGLRSRLIARLGQNLYKALFALVALLGLTLITIGMAARDISVLWRPPDWTGHLVIAAMLPAFILMAAAYLPSSIKRFTRHPMLWGVTLWAANRRGATKDNTVLPRSRDLITAGVGVIAYVLFIFLHPYIIGIGVLP